MGKVVLGQPNGRETCIFGHGRLGPHHLDCLGPGNDFPCVEVGNEIEPHAGLCLIEWIRIGICIVGEFLFRIQPIIPI
jgi:hypothetical protein